MSGTLETTDVLTAEALGFVERLHRELRGERLELLAARVERQRRLDAGERPGFLDETRSVREADWRVSPAPADLVDRLAIFRAGVMIGGDGLPGVAAYGLERLAAARRFSRQSLGETGDDVLETWTRHA